MHKPIIDKSLEGSSINNSKDCIIYEKGLMIFISNKQFQELLIPLTGTIWDQPIDSVWSLEKQLLIDTILREYDMRSFTRKVEDRKPIEFEVVDGQQRLTACKEFFENKFATGEVSETLMPQMTRKHSMIYPSSSRTFSEF